ncbi:MAG: hypothetical protein NVV62_12575 [Terricaulis sp.]|nr:hypothetical protein [Terricaulis sp.]
MCYHIASVRLAAGAELVEMRKHDAKIYSGILSLINEGDLRWHVEQMCHQGWITPEQLRALTAIEDYLGLVSSRCLIPQIETRRQAFVGALRSLLSFGGRHFFPQPNGAFYLYPDLNPDFTGAAGSADAARFFEKLAELATLCDPVTSSFDELIAAFNSHHAVR